MAHALLAAAAATVSRAARAVNTVAAADPVIWGAPVLLGHGRYLAPALTALPNPATGRLDAVLTTTDNGTVRTTDGGLTWRASGVGGGLDGLLTAGPVPHTFGDTEDRYQGTKRPFFDFWGVGAVAFAVDAAGALVGTAMGDNITFSGSPRPMGCIVTGCCNCPFRTNSGNAVRLPDGGQILAMNAFLAPPPNRTVHGDGSSVAVYTSDEHGVRWRFRSFVALAEDYPESGEGPNESTITLLADGKTLMCIVRMDAGDGHSAAKPYAKSFSSDSGRSWTPLVNMTSAPTSALVGTPKPRVVLMDPAKGPLVLIGGRPGNKVWVNPDGMGGDTWIEQLLPPAAQRWGSTCYNGIVALNSTAGIAAYDESGSAYYAVPFALSAFHRPA